MHRLFTLVLFYLLRCNVDLSDLHPTVRFQQLLRMEVPQETMDLIVNNGWTAARLNVISTPAQAEKLYNDAQIFPQEETRANVDNQYGIKIDGQLPVPGAQTALFLRAFEGPTINVIKIDHDQSKAKQERDFYEENADAARAYSLVPVKLLKLSGHYKSKNSPEKVLTYGLLMPFYTHTFDEYPIPYDAAYAFPKLLEAVEFMHSKGWMHGDIKPSNIFVDFKGNAWLGDYGSSVKFSDVESFSGGTPHYQCRVDHIKFPKLVDYTGLIISFLAKLGVKLPIPSLSELLEIVNTFPEAPFEQLLMREDVEEDVQLMIKAEEELEIHSNTEN